MTPSPVTRRPFAVRFAARPAIAPLLLWMAAPLALTLYFSLIPYNLLRPDAIGHFKFTIINYQFFLTDAAFWTSLVNTAMLVGAVLFISVGIGIAVAVLFSRPFRGLGAARLLVIAPFFVMPTVAALIWKNLLMHPVNGLFSHAAAAVGMQPVDWFSSAPLFAIVIIVAWQWSAFAGLILLTAMQSLDEEQRDAAQMDGASGFNFFIYIVLPHLARPIAAVVLIETIFLLAVFAEIFVTTNGGPGLETTNLAFLIYKQALLDYDVGGASAGGVIAVVIANIAAFFLMKIVGKTLAEEPDAN